jgi:hypothetical protein
MPLTDVGPLVLCCCAGTALVIAAHAVAARLAAITRLAPEELELVRRNLACREREQDLREQELANERRELDLREREIKIDEDDAAADRDDGYRSNDGPHF